MNFRKEIRPEAVGFQLAPMIDVVFLLLCFFMTSQIFAQWETEIDITLPTADTGQVPERLPGEIIINIRAGGELVVNAQLVTDEQLETMLGRVAEMFPGQPVLIRADHKTEYAHVIRVLDLCRQADIWNISFATGVPER